MTAAATDISEFCLEELDGKDMVECSNELYINSGVIADNTITEDAYNVIRATLANHITSNKYKIDGLQRGLSFISDNIDKPEEAIAEYARFERRETLYQDCLALASMQKLASSTKPVTQCCSIQLPIQNRSIMKRSARSTNALDPQQPENSWYGAR